MLNKQPSPAFSDDLIRRFLLGRLSSPEQTSLEEALFIDEELEARVRLAELDLTDDYVFARLNAADRERFDRKFLVSADRRQALNVSRALRDRFGPASLTGWRAAIGEKGLFLHLNRSVWRYAFAVLILSLLMATVWLVTKEPQIALRVFPKRAPMNAKAPAKSQEAQHSSSSPSMAHQEPSPAQPVHREVGSTIVLRANNEAPAIDLSGSDHGTIHVQLMLESNDEGAYQSELLTIDGRSVFSAEVLKQSDPAAKIDFDIPTPLLKRGEYKINLSRFDNGARNDVARYYLRVQ
jgi:anti-sigma factor RsiW